jgi:hypothetical protein
MIKLSKISKNIIISERINNTCQDIHNSLQKTKPILKRLEKSIKSKKNVDNRGY